MSTPSIPAPEPTVDTQGAAAPAPAPTRPLYWSVRRELWENRSITLAPPAVAAVVFLGFLISTFRLPERMRELPALDPAKQYQILTMPYNVVAGLTAIAAFIVAVFYCLDALHGERRDRSILFWKSLPVSDRTTVLAKAGVPLVVLPALVFSIVVVTQLAILLASSAVLLGSGVGVAPLWARLPLLQLTVAFLYGLTAMALWLAPLYSWLLLVSGWARRAPFLWAVLPPLAIAAFEGIAFRTSYVGQFLKHRLIGWFTEGFAVEGAGTVPDEPLTHLSPGRLLGSPGLWLGLIFAAAFLAAAVRLRRGREPL